MVKYKVFNDSDGLFIGCIMTDKEYDKDSVVVVEEVKFKVVKKVGIRVNPKVVELYVKKVRKTRKKKVKN